MRTPLEFRSSMLAVAVLLAACSKPAEPGNAAPAASPPDAAAAASAGAQASAPAQPESPDVPSEGDGQGDATVAGTPYHATAKIRCSGIPAATEGLCEAGVVRSAEGPIVDVMLPDGVKRVILFNADGSFLTFSTSEADGTAALTIASSREGDTTIATLGTERYEIPDAFVLGG